MTRHLAVLMHDCFTENTTGARMIDIHKSLHDRRCTTNLVPHHLAHTRIDKQRIDGRLDSIAIGHAVRSQIRWQRHDRRQ